MSATILDGKKIGEEIRLAVAAEVDGLLKSGRRAPKLVAVLVGDNPASEVYVRSKTKTAAAVGVDSATLRLASTISTADLSEEIRRLNADDGVDGILVQLPLPSGIDTDRVLEEVDVARDVDGFHPVNVGRLALGQPCLTPCTPAGIIEILLRSGVQIAGARACVIGRSRTVGRPVAALLLNRHATVTVCHSKTHEISSVTREADILIAAIGRAGFVRGEMIKPGATVIDVGINEVRDRKELERFYEGEELERKQGVLDQTGRTLVGDVEWRSALCVADKITPVPGGVGPLTIAMLMRNVVDAYRRRCRV